MTVLGQTAITYTYDNADRLTQITQGTTTVSFGHDAAGRRTSLTSPNGVVTEYSYDSASRLVGQTFKNGVDVLGTLTYGYDASGSRVTTGGTWAQQDGSAHRGSVGDLQRGQSADGLCRSDADFRSIPQRQSHQRWHKHPVPGTPGTSSAST